MKLLLDTDARQLTVDDGERRQTLALYSAEAFRLLSDQWLRVAWNEKYPYTFTWLGRPIIQYPEDMVRLQEVIYYLKPDVIIETGIAHGGSLIFSASLMKMMARGRVVVGVDVEIRPHNRKAIEAHELFSMIRLIEGDAVAPAIVAQAASHVRPGDTVLVILDSNHSYDHVRRELEAYHHLVTPGSYIVATDGIMREMCDVPRGQPAWKTDNPAQAARDFVAAHPGFAIEPPRWRFNESPLDHAISAWPDAWIRRRG